MLRVLVVDALARKMESAQAGDTGAGFFATRMLPPEYEALMARGTLTGSSDTAQVIPKDCSPRDQERRCPRTSTFDTLFPAW